MGPTYSGKRSVAAHLGTGIRRILTLDECVEWAVAAAGKKKLDRGGVENARLVEELIRILESQEGDGEVATWKKSRQLLVNSIPLAYCSSFKD